MVSTWWQISVGIFTDSSVAVGKGSGSNGNVLSGFFVAVASAELLPFYLTAQPDSNAPIIETAKPAFTTTCLGDNLFRLCIVDIINI